jgi:4-carboxymuconolactone decarboxylase
MNRKLPDDVHPQSRNRLPPPDRASLDDARRKHYDEVVQPGRTMAGLQGPAGIQMYSPGGPYLSALNHYLRFESGIAPALREIAILTSARETDSQFEWTHHEPAALKEGVPQAVIDLIKHRRPVEGAGLDEEAAIIIRLGRAMLTDHKVPADLYAAARKKFGEPRLVDIVLLIMNYAFTAGLLCAFDMQLKPEDERLLPERG